MVRVLALEVAVFWLLLALLPDEPELLLPLVPAELGEVAVEATRLVVEVTPAEVVELDATEVEVWFADAARRPWLMVLTVEH